MSEADIELNAIDFRWGSDHASALRAVLVHEIGHVLGLDHSCLPAGALGTACTDPVARSSAMYPNPLEPGRAFVLEPAERDLRLLTAPEPHRATGGCHVAAHHPDASVALLVVLCALARRRRRRSC